MLSALLTTPQDITSSQETTSQGAKSSKVHKIQVLSYKFTIYNKSTKYNTSLHDIYEQALLTKPSMILHYYNTLNSASFLTLLDGGEPPFILHDCVATIKMVSKPWENLLEVPLYNPGLLLFFDGSCNWNFQGNIITSYATVSPHKTLQAYFWPTVKSSQAAELIALMRACTLVKGNAATIYMDSRCAFGICSAVGTI